MVQVISCFPAIYMNINGDVITKKILHLVHFFVVLQKYKYKYKQKYNHLFLIHSYVFVSYVTIYFSLYSALCSLNSFLSISCVFIWKVVSLFTST